MDPKKIVGVIATLALLLVIGRPSPKVSLAQSNQQAGAPATHGIALTSRVYLPLLMFQWPFDDEFNGTQLDTSKWITIKGSPTVGGGQLTLPGGTTKAEIQSATLFQYKILEMAITSSDWKAQPQKTDSSFGFEIWTGANGQCHYGVILVANGTLGVIRSEPDGENKCTGDPKYQEYPPISNWDAVRAAGTIYLTLIWSSSNVTLYVNDGGSNSGQASYAGDAIPTVQAKVRLNADLNETYRVDYVRVY
jgi:hypothetical protein